MKTHLLLTCLLATALGSSHTKADILLGAPGVPAGTRIATKVPFMINYALPDSYKFIFSGIQAKGDTLGAPGASGTNGNGGQFHLQATVSASNDGSERAGLIEFRDIQDYNSSPLQTILLSPVAVFKATSSPITINLQWKGNGNAHKPNGIFNILGEYQKDPPIPTGSLTFVTGPWILEESPNPEGTVTIVRE
jgi:hypothetical protein